MTWPDIVIIGVGLLGAFKGYKSGFVAELTGIIALVAAITAGFVYSGFWDGAIEALTKLGPGSAHVLGIVAFAGAIYALVIAIGVLLGRIMKFPILKTVNALLGAGVGAIKALIFVWAILYVTLFFPLPTDLRADLHRSQMVAALTQPNDQLDQKFHDSLPWFAKLFATPFFTRHHV
ncbi:MAG TPA: CvpA family protein [Candidatus Baltobacteraceae bacterium]